MEILIVNPITLENVPLQEWKQSENPQSAELIVIKTEDKELYLLKRILPERYKFDEAQKAAAEFCPVRKPSQLGDFRNPTRKEAIDIYDARFAGLDEAIELLGGDSISGHWYWTSESDPDPECSSYDAFISNGNLGILGSDSKYYTNAVRPVSAFLNR